MAAPLAFGGITRLQSTSSVTASSGVTFARTKSGPTVNTGFSRAARNTCPSTAPGAASSRRPAIQARIIVDGSGRPGAAAERAEALGGAGRAIALHANRRELARVVLVERELLLDHAVLEERVLHHRERVQTDVAVDRQQRPRDPVGGQHGLRRPAELLRDDLGGV